MIDGMVCNRYCTVPQVSIEDWPSFPVRGAHIHQLGDKDLTAVFYEQADRMAAHKMNLFSAMTTDDITTVGLEKNAEFLLAMQK